MTLSGWTRLWIIAAVLGIAGCNREDDTADVALSTARDALQEAQDAKAQLEEALERIEELEVQLYSAEDDIEALQSATY